MLKTTFLGGILLGFAAVVSAAGFYPWVDHERPVSRTQVIPNGGRSEDFFIHLPVDRIASLGAEELTVGGTAFPAGLALPEGFLAGSVQVEHFKIRDRGDDVIGVASRHTVGFDGAAAVTWSLSFPSRGALWLAGQVAPADLRSAALALANESGPVSGSELELRMGNDDGPSGEILGGTSEFDGLTGSYLERWHLGGIGEAGELRGRIELNTTSFLTQ